MPELREDPLTGELVLLAPGRAARPHTVPRVAPGPVDPPSCPFCPGHEAETPPEVARVGGGTPNGPGWRLRAFPNLYPIVGGSDAAPGATGAHEVVVLSPEHDRDLARLSDSAAAELFALLRERSRSLAAAGHAHVQVSVNHGAAAGASIVHPHAQILALDFVPPTVAAALTRFTAAGADLVDSDADRAEELETVVASVGATRAWCAAASSVPYEVRVADRDAGPRFAAAPDGALEAVACTVRDVLATLATVLTDAAYNVVIYDAPSAGTAPYHWWIRVVPRVSVPAGFELGTGVLVETVDPRRAADALRTATR